MSNLFLVLLVVFTNIVLMKFSFKEYICLKRLPAASLALSFASLAYMVISNYGIGRSLQTSMIFMMTIILLIATLYFFRIYISLPKIPAGCSLRMPLHGELLDLSCDDIDTFRSFIYHIIVCAPDDFFGIGLEYDQTYSREPLVSLDNLEFGITKKFKFSEIEPVLATPERIVYLFERRYLEFSFPGSEARGFLRILNNSVWLSTEG